MAASFVKKNMSAAGHMRAFILTNTLASFADMMIFIMTGIIATVGEFVARLLALLVCRPMSDLILSLSSLSFSLFSLPLSLFSSSSSSSLFQTTHTCKVRIV